MSELCGQKGLIAEDEGLDRDLREVDESTLFSPGLPFSTLDALQVADVLGRAPRHGEEIDDILEYICREINPGFSCGGGYLGEDERAFLNEVCPEGDDMRFSERLTILNDFYGSESVVSHADAIVLLENMFPALCEEVSFDKWIFQRVPAEDMYSTREAHPVTVESLGDLNKRDLIQRLEREIQKVFGGKKYAFLNFPSDLKAVQLAMKCPRFLQKDGILEKLAMTDDLTLPEASLLAQLLFLNGTEYVFKENDGHRWAYVAALISGLYAEEVGRKESIPPTGRSFRAPSLGLFEKFNEEDEETRKNKGRQYINAMLSLILPDKKDGDSILFESGACRPIVQEDFISVDLMGLANSLGIYQEYDEIFKSLFRMRQAAFIKSQHLKRYSSESTESSEKERKSLVDVITEFEIRNGRKPTVVSVGHGDGVLEQMLLLKGLVESVHAVDLHDAEELSEKNFVARGKNGEEREGVFKRVFKGEEDDSSRINRVFDCLPKADIVVCSDSLHETENPAEYMAQAIKLVNPGGFFYYTDPVMCDATDEATKTATWPIDMTRHPSSMRPLEAQLEALVKEILQGNSVDHIGIIPPPFGAYNDVIWRITVVLKIAEEDAIMDYTPPAEYVDWDECIESDFDIFKVWPLNLIVNDDSREHLIARLKGVTGNSLAATRLENGEKLRYRDVKMFVVKWLLTAREEENRGGLDNEGVEGESFLEYEIRNAEALIKREGPYSDILKSLLRSEGLKVGKLEEINRFAGEVGALCFLLGKEFKADFVGKVRETPGWNHFECAA